MTKKSKALKKYIRKLNSSIGVNFAVEFRFVEEGSQGNSYLKQFNTEMTSTEEAFVEMCVIATNCIKLDDRFSDIPDRNYSFVLRPDDICEMKRKMSKTGCHSYRVQGWFEVFMVNLDRKYIDYGMIKLVGDFKDVLGEQLNRIVMTNFGNRQFKPVDLNAVLNNPGYINMTKKIIEVEEDLPVIVKKKDRDGHSSHDLNRNTEINKRKDYEKRSEGELIYYESNQCWYIKEDGQFKYIGKTLKDEFSHLVA